MKIKTILTLLFVTLLSIPIFAQTASVEDTVSGMQWVSFLTPVIVWIATELSRAIKKLPPYITLIIVAGLSSITGYLMQLGEQTEHWYFTALIGLGSVFINEFRKSLNTN